MFLLYIAIFAAFIITCIRIHKQDSEEYNTIKGIMIADYIVFVFCVFSLLLGFVVAWQFILNIQLYKLLKQSSYSEPKSN